MNNDKTNIFIQLYGVGYLSLQIFFLIHGPYTNDLTSYFELVFYTAGIVTGIFLILGMNRIGIILLGFSSAIEILGLIIFIFFSTIGVFFSLIGGGKSKWFHRLFFQLFMVVYLLLGFVIVIVYSTNEGKE